MKAESKLPDLKPAGPSGLAVGLNLIRGLKLAALFVVLVYFGWVDLRFAISGEVTEARVVSAERVNPPHNKSIDVHYRFRDPRAGTRTETDNLAHWADIPKGTVQIQFIPGSRGMSRVDGPLSVFLCLVLYGGSLVLLICVGMYVWSLFNKPQVRTMGSAST